MSVGELAGLLAAIALCVLVALAAVPLLKAGRALDELRLAVRDVGHNSVPVLVELKSTVENTNDELAKLSAVTEDVAKVSANATVVSEHAANLSQLFAATLGGPLVKTAAVVHGVRSALKGRKK
ncbi:MAG: DUF948 domain-containing protein [Propionibacteriaceae bacterium]|nr:DUF948 domain-containing protein [Propionibacteriaceae bacterium]